MVVHQGIVLLADLLDIPMYAWCRFGIVMDVDDGCEPTREEVEGGVVA